jgi:hypothetical protein
MPEGHPSRAVPAQNLARMLLAAGRLDEAQSFAEEAHALHAAGLPTSHPLTLATEVVLAQLALARKDEGAARTWLALAATAIAANPVLPPTLRAAVHETRAQIAQAHAHQTERVAALSDLFAPTHPRFAQMQLEQAEALFAANDQTAATALTAKIAPILHAELVPQAPALARLAALERDLASQVAASPANRKTAGRMW